MSQLTQENRLISIATPLAKDELLLTSFQGSEHISALFEFQLDVLSSNLSVSPQELVGKQITVTIQNEQKRVFHGYVNRFSFGEVKADNLRQYSLTMVPWFWFLSKTQDNRIFQNKSTKEIVTDIFKEMEFKDYEFKAKGGEKREYCVQYGESDFHFISRLLEEEGIAYYFRHEKDKHVLVLVDEKNAYKDCPETDLTYSKGNQPNTQITKWTHGYEFRQGEWTLNDYNFKDPKKKLTVSTASSSKFSNNAKYEHYDYPGMYDTTLGKTLAGFRMEAEEVPMDVIDASSDCSSFYAGGKFSLKKHDAKAEKGNYIIITVLHNATDSSYFSGSEGNSSYSNDFKCIPAEVHFRPQHVHTKPIMNGPQSAIVTGPAGEEISIDEFGRISVRFIWDRAGKMDHNSSCDLRVVQSWAGNQWGASFIPRIGHEVIVNFLDGDPDRPLVTGSVYNGDNKPPYSSKTQSGIKTRSTKGGSKENYNELRFEDLKGSEQILIHAEKDMDVEVENNETLTVDNDRTKLIKHDENSTIENDRNKTVNKNQTETIGENKTIDVGKIHRENIKKDMTIRIGGDLKEEVDGQYTENVTKDYKFSAKSITMVADDKITLQTGSAKIVMKSNGDILLSGNNINIKGSGNISIKGSKVTTN